MKIAMATAWAKMDQENSSEDFLAWPFAVDLGRGEMHVGPLPLEIASSVPFLDHRLPQEFSGKARPEKITSLKQRIADNSQSASLQRERVFIFHSAFCGSTLLAQLLSLSSNTTSFSEPHVLTQLAHAKRSLGIADKELVQDAQMQSALDLCLDMIDRHHAKTTLIKPSNFANNLIADLLNRSTRVLFLYGSLESFLRSLMRRGWESSVFVRQMWQAMRADRGGIAYIPAEAAATYTDLQIAAILWTYQIETFAQFLRKDGGRKCRSICFDLFADDKLALVQSVQGFLTPCADPRKLRAQLEKGALERDSKTGESRQDIEARERLSSHEEGVLQDVLQWAEQVRFGQEPALPLPEALEIKRSTS